MARNLSILIALAAFCIVSCSSLKKSDDAMLDAGPPPRPLFVELDGLKWGMTKEEVKDVWGPPDEEGYRFSYASKSGYESVELTFYQVPDSNNPHEDLKPREGDDPFTALLYWISFNAPTIPKGEDLKAKDTYRQELIEKHGDPLTDAILQSRMNCESPHCEIFRPAECTVLLVRWRDAVPELKLPARLGSLAYYLMPDKLLREISRTKWSTLRGSIKSAIPEDFKAKIESFSKGAQGTPVEEILEQIGKPNFYFKEAEDQWKLYYFWLTGSYYVLTIENGKLQNVNWSVYTG